MIRAQVCFGLATIKGRSERCSFITQGVFCWNICQSCCQWTEYLCHYHKSSLKWLLRIRLHVQTGFTPGDNHSSPGPPCSVWDLRPATRTSDSTTGWPENCQKASEGNSQLRLLRRLWSLAGSHEALVCVQAHCTASDIHTWQSTAPFIYAQHQGHKTELSWWFAFPVETFFLKSQH